MNRSRVGDSWPRRQRASTRVVHHERDIALLPIAFGPRLGFNLAGWPTMNFVVELLYGISCWAAFGGSIALLIAIVVLNVLNLPLMFPRPGTGALLSQHPAALPTIILAQIVLTWIAVWYFGRSRTTTRWPGNLQPDCGEDPPR